MMTPANWKLRFNHFKHELGRFWKPLWSDVHRDLHDKGWLQLMAWLGISIWIFVLFALLVILLLGSTPALLQKAPYLSGTHLLSIGGRTTEACLPDGSFDIAFMKLSAARYNWWKSSGFFQITLGFGVLSFTQAKVLDVAWDIVSNYELSSDTMTCLTFNRL